MMEQSITSQFLLADKLDLQLPESGCPQRTRQLLFPPVCTDWSFGVAL